MKALDFEYDGYLLSDFGFMICSFGDKGLETISNGSKISFNTTPIFNGSKSLLTQVSYDENIECNFAICKNPCVTASGDVEPITATEESQIMRWLNRKKFLKFRVLQDGYEDIYFNGSFNIDKYVLDGNVYGFELTFTSNRPYAIYDSVMYNFTISTENGNYVINDISDEIGHIYAKMKIKCLSSGNLIINNSIEKRDTVIKNCTQNEIITLDYPIIESTLISHKLQNDFNFNFVRIANTYENTLNKLTFSLPCEVQLSYNPIKKVGV